MSDQEMEESNGQEREDIMDQHMNNASKGRSFDRIDESSPEIEQI